MYASMAENGTANAIGDDEIYFGIPARLERV